MFPFNANSDLPLMKYSYRYFLQGELYLDVLQYIYSSPSLLESYGDAKKKSLARSHSKVLQVASEKIGGQ